ncbi:hypothetical protein DPMN_076886 [Dreissena polymorpha]|uniref:Uncharacterized protein n=1 Tax=Dreissena polymorpha TaxID=45954 RepID=A0A9D3YME3_DREPO|nr:hypothetical protein DPMN_076886 [Dreissena polymorpha]
MRYSLTLPLLLLACIVSSASAFSYGYETNTLPPECALVLCARPDCDNPFTPPGQCCPTCRRG